MQPELQSKKEIVHGGGTALLHSIQSLGGLKGQNPSQAAGIDIVRKALEATLQTDCRECWC